MKRVVVTGSFDIIHSGHIFLFKEAAKLGELHVIVGRDSTILKIKKQPPIIPEQQRLEIVQAIRYVHSAVLGNENTHYLKKVIELKPKILLLGPNQKVEISDLIQQLKELNHPEIEVQRLNTLFVKSELNSSTAIKEKIKRQYELKD